MVDALRRELRQALRTSLRNPGFSLVVLVTLALGIGATTAIFTVLDHVVLRPLPYSDPSRLLWIDSPAPGVRPDAKFGLSVAEFFFLKKTAHTIQDLATYSKAPVTVTGKDGANRVPAGYVSAGFFKTLRMHAIAGRLLVSDDDRPHAAPVVVLGYDYWRDRFNEDPRVIGSTVNIEMTSYEVVGILEPATGLESSRIDLWVPQELDEYATPESSYNLSVLARLAPGATLESAQRELIRLTHRLPELYPSAYPPGLMKVTRLTTEAISLRDHVVGDLAKNLWMLLGAVALVLVIACVNVANLFLVRTEGRRREVAIRTALGARRSDLARQLITESLLLGAIAGAAALGLAAIGLRVMLALLPPDFPRLEEIHLDWSSVAFTFVISVAAGLLFGFLAFLSASGTPEEDSTTLREGGRGLTSSRRRHAVRGTLVAAQCALALVLLSASGLMLQSLRNMRNVPLGFESANVFTAEINLPYGKYKEYEQIETFYHQLLPRVAAIPGITLAGAGEMLPLNENEADGCGSALFAESHPEWGVGSEMPPCAFQPEVTPGYFRTLGIHVRGQEPGWSDVEHRIGGVVVTKALAARFWPGQDPIGKGVRAVNPGPPYYHVVGVADDLRIQGLDKPPAVIAFFPVLPIAGLRSMGGFPLHMDLVIRSGSTHPEALAASVRRVLADIDPNVPLVNVRTMDQVIAVSMTRLSLTMLLLGIAATVALILSAVGIYGVISYIVGRRRAEIGLRMALGARPSRAGALVMLQSLRFTGAGILIGLLGAVATARLLRSVLFGVSPNDPLILVVVSVVMLVIAVLASFVPTRRAMAVDPVEALRAD